MTTETLYHTALVLHIIAIIMVAGTTLVDYVTFKQFWKQLATDKQKGMVVLSAMAKSPMLFGIGFLLIIISGVYMMAATHGAFGEQTWFRIKFGLIILIILNGLIIGRRQGLKLRSMLSETNADKNIEGSLVKIKRNMGLFHVSQLVMLVIIFVLSIFKFN
jgi:hypothetical protein